MENFGKHKEAVKIYKKILKYTKDIDQIIEKAKMSCEIILKDHNAAAETLDSISKHYTKGYVN